MIESVGKQTSLIVCVMKEKSHVNHTVKSYCEAIHCHWISVVLHS